MLLKDSENRERELSEIIKRTVEEAAKCVAATIVKKTLVSSAQIVIMSAEKFNAELEETLKKHLKHSSP